MSKRKGAPGGRSGDTLAVPSMDVETDGLEALGLAQEQARRTVSLRGFESCIK